MNEFEQLQKLKKELLNTSTAPTSSAFHTKIKYYEDALKKFYNKELSHFIRELTHSEKNREIVKAYYNFETEESSN